MSTPSAVIHRDPWSGGWSIEGQGSDARFRVALARPSSWTPEVDDEVRQHVAAFGYVVTSTRIAGGILVLLLSSQEEE